MKSCRNALSRSRHLQMQTLESRLCLADVSSSFDVNRDNAVSAIDALQGQSGVESSIRMGFQDGDLQINPSRWIGKANTGEFELSSSWIRF
ncbi:MAG: hypothetical protein AAF802_01580 [Planctomycetota bacterium]